jgi:hypothetical protein
MAKTHRILQTIYKTNKTTQNKYLQKYEQIIAGVHNADEHC